MNQDRLLVSLGRLAREQIEADELHGRAPLDEAARDRIAGALTRELSATAMERRRPRALPRALPALCVLAAAAAATGLVVGLRGEAPEPMSAQAATSVPVPDYQVEVTGGDVIGANRAAGEAATGPTLIGEGAVIRVVLRPERPAPAEAAVVACLARGASIRPWDVRWERSAQGSFLTRGTRESLFAGEAAGDVEILFVVGRSGELPACDEVAKRAVLRARVRIR